MIYVIVTCNACGIRYTQERRRTEPWPSCCGQCGSESITCAPRCLEGCSNTSRPYCHCQQCGATGAVLDEHGYCAECTDEQADEHGARDDVYDAAVDLAERFAEAPEAERTALVRRALGSLDPISAAAVAALASTKLADMFQHQAAFNAALKACTERAQCVISVPVEYDADATDPEGLATMIDRLLRVAVSAVPLEEYGTPPPRIGETFITPTRKPEEP